jgi:Amt family ammonium transporter
MLMTPGIALFYGGMVRRSSVLSVIGQAFAGMAVITVVWVTIAFSLAFGGSGWFLGGLSAAGIPVNAPNPVQPGIPFVGFAVFQLMLAILAGTLILGAGAERWRFAAYLVFAGVWVALVYAPVAHWIFDARGWAAQWGMVDFAGGTVVQITAGAAAIGVAVSLGRRPGWPDEPTRPHNLPLVMTGLALLWFGWLGLAGGSAYTGGVRAAAAVLNAQVAACAGLLAWVLMDRARYGKPTVLGAASGAVSGLVAISAGAGEVTTLAALGIGVLAGVACHLVVSLKRWFQVDDALDVAAVHLGGGLIGCVAVGLFATDAVHPGGHSGLFYGGGYRLLGVELATAAAVIVYALVGTFLIAGVVNSVLGQRVRRRHEVLGLDLAQHGESAYDLTPAPVPADAGPAAITAH